MEKKKYQVFISSTYNDLKEQRDKVRDAILSMYHFPVGMELFGAADEEQWEIIKETIDTSDYYVLLVGQRYGTVISEGEDKGISYTEKEFRYAKEKRIPILAFMIDDSVPVPPGNVETEHIKEFQKFKESVKRGRTVEWWKNPDDLAQKVTASLYKQISRKPRPGWIRGDSLNENDEGPNVVTQIVRPYRYTISIYASLMLMYAAESDGRIIVYRSLAGLSFQAGKYTLQRNQSGREIANWDDAVDQLVEHGYIKLIGSKDRIYTVTKDGYDLNEAFVQDNELDPTLSPNELLKQFGEY